MWFELKTSLYSAASVQDWYYFSREQKFHMILSSAMTLQVFFFLPKSYTKWAIFERLNLSVDTTLWTLQAVMIFFFFSEHHLTVELVYECAL